MNILLLGGTFEARILAKQLENNSKYFVTVSMAGVTKAPLKYSENMRFGGFGGQKGLKNYLKINNIDALVDVTHPFASNITYNAKVVCEELDIPRILYERKAWIEQKNDKWLRLDCEHDLIPHLNNRDVVFIASGRQSAAYFKDQKNIFLICRQIDKPTNPFPYGNGRYLISRPPFSVESETQLFEDLKVNWLLVKDSGGSQSEAKLIAARKLGINVALLNRPKSFGGTIVSELREVGNWLEGLGYE